MFKECFALEKIHGCVRYGTKISLPNGEEVEIQKLKTGDIVLSFDEVKKEFKNSKILSVIKQEITNKLKWVALTFETGKTLVCTEDHPILTSNRGWVNSIDLSSDDEIIDISM